MSDAADWWKGMLAKDRSMTCFLTVSGSILISYCQRQDTGPNESADSEKQLDLAPNSCFLNIQHLNKHSFKFILS